MFFTKTARMVAFLIFGLCVLRVVLGVLLALGTDTVADNQAAARYLLGARNTGEAINEGIIGILVAIVLGMLSEISRNIASRPE